MFSAFFDARPRHAVMVDAITHDHDALHMGSHYRGGDIMEVALGAIATVAAVAMVTVALAAKSPALLVGGIVVLTVALGILGASRRGGGWVSAHVVTYDSCDIGRSRPWWHFAWLRPRFPRIFTSYGSYDRGHHTYSVGNGRERGRQYPGTPFFEGTPSYRSHRGERQPTGMGSRHAMPGGMPGSFGGGSTRRTGAAAVPSFHSGGPSPGLRTGQRQPLGR